MFCNGAGNANHAASEFVRAHADNLNAACPRSFAFCILPSVRHDPGRRNFEANFAGGHVVIARKVGFKIASAWIMPNAREDAEGERAWIGRVQIVCVRADKFACRMVGVAGSVAEHLWLGGWIDDYFPDTLSEGDWHLTGCDPDQPDDTLMEAIVEVGQLLAREGSLWHELF